MRAAIGYVPEAHGAGYPAQYEHGPDYPVLQDLTAALRPFARDPGAYDRFVAEWFSGVVLPEYRLSDVRKEVCGGGHEVTLRLENGGSGRMPVEVAAVRGERFDGAGRMRPGYREARQVVWLDGAEGRALRFVTDFEPERVVVDPDVKVLQLRRRAAAANLR